MFKLIDNPSEGELVQYLGVYVTKWRDYFGEPSVGFIQYDITTLDDLIELFNNINLNNLPDNVKNVMSICIAALLMLKEKDNNEQSI